MTRIIGAPTLDDALAQLRERVAQNEERGERTLIFCEDRLTLLAERAILSAVGGTFLAEVTTFARFLSGEAKALSKQGSVMEIAALLAEHEKELLCFRRNSAQAVYETIAQFSASRVDAGLIRAGAEQTDGMLKNKLLDLSLLFEEYAAFLRERGMVDENGYLALLPARVEERAKGMHVVFFAFPSFTRQALEGVRAALSAADDVTGIFLAGREEIYTNEGVRAFRGVCEEEGPAQYISAERSLPDGEAPHLLRGLFSPECYRMPVMRTERVRRFSAADEGEEYSVVAALIKKHIFEGMRYRDIAVLVPGEESFPALEKAFSAYKIPYFSDKKRPFSRHPFCVFALAALGAAADGCLPAEADAIASSRYFGAGERYRNYLLKYGGYRGAVRREIKRDVKGFDVKELSVCRERMLAILALFPKKGKGNDFVRGVRELVSLVDAETATEALRAYFTGAEREFLDLSPLQGVLSEIETVAGGQTFTAREFAQMLKSGLDALEIAMIPQSADAVFVGDATESKFERVRVLFATGLTTALPRAAQDTAIISDGELEKLGSLKVEVEPAIAQVNARARESFALNLCSFTEALYLSYPLGKGGSDAERGEVFQYAEKLFDMPPMPELFPFDCCEEEPAALRLLSLSHEGRGAEREKFSALYAVCCRFRGKEDVDRLLRGGGKEPVAALGDLVFSGQASPTLLESYFACPYAGFANRALRLREREERPVLDTDAGTFVHEVLERTAQKFNDFSGAEECRAYARETGRELIASPRYSALSDTDAGKYAAERLVREGEEVSAAAYRQLALSAFRVKQTEGKIVLPELSLAGKADRIDESDGYIRVIDYKTGEIDDAGTSYYTGRKLQLELYLRAAAKGGIPAGAFYFPAAEIFTEKDEAKFCMSGFYSREDDVMLRLDKTLEEGKKSELFGGRLGGTRSDHGMEREDFEAFLDYSLLVSARAEEEMRAGNIAPSPYDQECRFCKLRSLCAFTGAPRKEGRILCGEIAKIVRRERGEK